MGLFNMHYDRPGPGVEKDAPRKTGIARWFEIIGRDLWDFTKANFITMACFAPTGIVAALTITWLLLDPNLLVMLLGIVLGSAFGFLIGPALCGMQALMLKSLRDEPKFFWHTYKKAFKENFKQGALVGIVFTFVLLIQVFGFILYFRNQASVWMMALLVLDILIITMVMIFFIPQLVMLDLSMKVIFTNSLRMSLGFLPRSLPAALIEIALFVVQVLFLPLSLPILIVLGLWLPIFSGLFIVYKPIDKIFHIEEQFAERKEKEMQEFTQNNSVK